MTLKLLKAAIPQRFFQFCDELKVTQMDLPTAYFNLLGHDLDGVEIPERLRLVTFGGEAVGPESVAAWRKKLKPSARMINFYGPTEATVNCTYYEIMVDEPAGPIPIGKPQINNRLYVLDRHLNLSPLGTPGELHIGGPQVATGYLGEPDLTSERFIPDPFSENGEARIYKTGDMVRYRPDGQLEFLGRTDHQVKIRGFRIELHEIQTAVEAHPSVREAYIMVREDIPGSMNLTAYLVPAGGRKIDPAGLKAFVRDRLPGYMIPADMVILERLPIASGGKIDRDSLPPPPGRQLNKSRIQPRTPIEKLLAGLFSRTLKVDKVGLDDDFFDLGGHSLLAIKLISKLEKEMGRSLAVTTLFEAPTVAKLARVLDQAMGSKDSSFMVKIKSGEAERPFFHIGQVDKPVRTFAKYLDISNPVYLLHVQPLDPKAPLLTDVREIADYCLEEIRKVQPQGPYLLSGYCLGGLVAFEIAQRLLEVGEEINYLGLFECYLPESMQPKPGMTRSARIKSMVRFYLDQRPRKGFISDLIWVFIRLCQKCLNTAWSLICRMVHSFSARLNRPAPLVCKNEMVALGLAQKGYLPEPYPGSASIFRAAEIGPWLDVDPDLGWSEYIRGEVTVIQVPGDHASMYDEPNVAEFAKMVEESLRNKV